MTGTSTVAVMVGDTVTIRLPENATTGYVWSVRTIGAGLELVSDEMNPGSGALALGPPVGVGAAGERLVRVRAIAPVDSEVVLRLGREWERAPVDEWRVTVRIG